MLKTLEDIGWETVDNLPLSLLDRLLSSPPAQGAPDAGLNVTVRTDGIRGIDAAASEQALAGLRAGGATIA